MKTKLLAVLAFGITTAIVTLYPGAGGISAVIRTNSSALKPVEENHAKIEAVFVLDTTGSMSGLIQAAKDKIWSIASSMAAADSQPEIRIGLVAYRDRGDDYVTRVVDLSEDLDTMYATLMDFQANGGGDGPESVNQALYDAVHSISWSVDENVYRVVFLVGDAPPHMDYQDDVKFPETLAAATKKGIAVNAIQCGANPDTGQVWQQIAQLGLGEYVQVEQGGNTVAVKTPFDEKLAELSAKLDSTRLYYGSAEEKAKQAEKLRATEKLHRAASVQAQARRAEFNVSKSGRSNLAGKGDLVEDVVNGGLKLADVDAESLPEPLKPMAPAEREAVIEEKAELREKLTQEIQSLAAKRSEYMKQELKKRDGAKDSLDQQLFDMVREQAAHKGLVYSSDGPAY